MARNDGAERIENECNVESEEKEDDEGTHCMVYSYRIQKGLNEMATCEGKGSVRAGECENVGRKRRWFTMSCLDLSLLNGTTALESNGIMIERS